MPPPRPSKRNAVIDTLADESGNLDVGVPLPQLLVPRLLASGEGRLRFDGLHAQWAKRRPVPANLLSLFVRVQTDSAVTNFARQFGPLGLFPTEDAEPQPNSDRLHEAPDHQEEIQWWQRYQQEFHHLLVFIAFIRNHGDLSPADIEYLLAHDEPIGTPVPVSAERRSEFDRDHEGYQRFAAGRVLQWRLNDFVERCGLRPWVSFDSGMADGDFVFADSRGEHVTLFGALTAQLLGLVHGTGGWGICGGCRSVFSPSRLHRKYCVKCAATGVSKTRAKSVANVKRRHMQAATKARRR